MTIPQSVFAIVPPTGVYVREDRCQTPLEKFRTVALRPPIDLMYAASAFEKGGAHCALVDYPAEGQGWAELERDLRVFRPDLLVLSVTTQTAEADMEAAVLAKSICPNVVTVAKGAHFNTCDVEMMERHPELDLALREEIEEACAEIASGVDLADVAGVTWRDESGKVIRNPARGFTKDLDGMAFPSRHLANNALYIRPDTGRPQTTLITNRGCPYHCIYCLANQVAGTTNRYRSVDNVLAEIRECVEQHGIDDFLFRSDLFTQNKAWVLELCTAIVDEGLDIQWACNARVDTVDEEVLVAMKRAGCWIIAFGVESGDQDALDRMEKKARVEDSHRAIRLCRRVGIKSSVYLLLGLPWDDQDAIDRQARFGTELDPDILEFFYPYPFPGTPLQRICVEMGLLSEGEIPMQSYAEPAFATEHLSKEQLKAARNRALRRFYVRPSKVARTLAGAGSLSELGNYLRVGISQLRLLAES